MTNKLWDFQKGDKVFCIWPYGRLEGGFHTVKDVLTNSLAVEGLPLYYENRRFIKIATTDEYQLSQKPNINEEWIVTEKEYWQTMRFLMKVTTYPEELISTDSVIHWAHRLRDPKEQERWKEYLTLDPITATCYHSMKVMQ